MSADEKFAYTADLILRGLGKLQRDAINTVTFICRCVESLAFKHMTQVPATSRARNLDSPSIRIRLNVWIDLH